MVLVSPTRHLELHLRRRIGVLLNELLLPLAHLVEFGLALLEWLLSHLLEVLQMAPCWTP